MIAAKYKGSPCKCGLTLRYQSTGRCVACVELYNKSDAAKKVRKKFYASPQGKLFKKVANASQRKKRSDESKDAQKIYAKSYRLTEKGKIVNRVGAQKHRAKYLNIEGSYTTKEWLELKQLYGCRCLCCGRHESELKAPLEQDHMIPLSKGGTNWITNIQPLCETCNGMGGKGTRIIDYRKK